MAPLAHRYEGNWILLPPPSSDLIFPVMTTTIRQTSERNLNERLALSGPGDELKDVADTIDGLLARLEAG